MLNILVSPFLPSRLRSRNRPMDHRWFVSLCRWS